MKFKLIESVKRLRDEVYATYSLIDLKLLLQKDLNPKRLAYCPDTELWLVADATMIYHVDMVYAANDAGLTDINIENDTFGRHYYIPYKFETIPDLYQDFIQEFPEVRKLEVFPDFVLGSDEKSDPIGEAQFFALFENPIIPITNIENLTEN